MFLVPVIKVYTEWAEGLAEKYNFGLYSAVSYLKAPVCGL